MGRRNKISRRPVRYFDAVETLASVLRSDTRRRIVGTTLRRKNFRASFSDLRRSLYTHRFSTGATRIDLSGLVQSLDRRTQREGLYVLNAWDHDQQGFLRVSSPVLLLEYCVAYGVPAGFGPTTLAILLDYYFLQLLGLAACRAWDEGSASENLQRISKLVRDLQGEEGSGFRFVEDAETILLLAISQYHPDESAYGRLLKKVEGLEQQNRLALGEIMAAMLGGHLRWGFQDLYATDTPRVREDNEIDYPWLLFAQWTLLQHFEQCREINGAFLDEGRIALGLLNGFSADPGVFLGEVPEFLSDYRERILEFQQCFSSLRRPLLELFQKFEPPEDRFSPLSFRFNFPHNVLVAMIVTSVMSGKLWEQSLNDLLVGSAGHCSKTSALARTLTAFSAAPDRRDSKGSVQVIYAPADGRNSFARTMNRLVAGAV